MRRLKGQPLLALPTLACRRELRYSLDDRGKSCAVTGSLTYLLTSRPPEVTRYLKTPDTGDSR